MRTILLNHAQRYPAWGVPDMYKLIHQAAMGSEHAISDEIQVREFLLKELANFGPGPDEPLLDPITPDGKLLRIHLRPFVQLNLNQEELLSAFIRTGEMISPSAEKMSEYSNAAYELALDGRLGLKAGAISDFIQTMTVSAFPAVHHTHEFQKAYSPAYRVVMLELIPDDFLTAE